MPTNPTPEEKRLTFQEILEGEFLTVHYQPVVSVNPRAIAAYEGLCRGVDPTTLRILSPNGLFAWAVREGKTVEFDRLCRKRVLEYFRAVHKENPGILLDVNLGPTGVAPGAQAVLALVPEVEAWGFKPQDILWEVRESQVNDPEMLRDFIRAARNAGFRVGLEEVGGPGSHPNWLPRLNPDVVKTHRSLSRDLEDDAYRQEMVRAIGALAHRSGSLLAVAGLETEGEARTALKLGADWLQGHWIGEPTRYDKLNAFPSLAALEGLEDRRKSDDLERLRTKRFHLGRFESILGDITDELTRGDREGFEMILHGQVAVHQNLRGCFVVDTEGVQVTEWVGHAPSGPKRNHRAFQPSAKGSDHSTRDYFYMIMEGGLRRLQYVSDPALSRLTGRPVLTFATAFQDNLGTSYLLCVEVDEETLSESQAPKAD